MEWPLPISLFFFILGLYPSHLQTNEIHCIISQAYIHNIFWWIFFFLVNISTIVLNIFCSWYGNDVYTVDKEELPKNLFVPKTKPAENSAILKNQNLLSQYSRLKFQIFIFISFFIFCFFVLMPIKNGNWR